MQKEVRLIKNHAETRVNEKSLDIVCNIIKNNKRYFGSSGASLTHENKKTFSKGKSGENSTTKIILEWIKDKPNAVLIDSLHLKGMGRKKRGAKESKGDTDHVLIFNNKIILIDSKNWKDKKIYTVQENGTIKRNNRTFKGGYVKAREAMTLWKKYLAKYSGYKISQVILIAHNDVIIPKNKHWYRQPYKLLSYKDIIEYLDEIYYNETESFINLSLVTLLATGTVKPKTIESNVPKMLTHIVERG